MMEWGAVGAVAELLGAIGVVISLIYLATQVRQGTRATRSATRQAVVDSIVNGAMIWPQSPDFARVLQDHLEGKDLEPHEYQRLQAYCFANLRNWENVHFHYRNGLLSEEDWEGFRMNLKALLQIPAWRDYWRREQDIYSEIFREEVEAMLSELDSESVVSDSVLFDRSTSAEPGQKAWK